MHDTQNMKPPYLMIAILFFGAFVSFLNNSLLNVALPSIMVDLNIENYSTVQWLATGYMLVSGVLIPVSAFLITKLKTVHYSLSQWDSLQLVQQSQRLRQTLRCYLQVE